MVRDQRIATVDRSRKGQGKRNRASPLTACKKESLWNSVVNNAPLEHLRHAFLTKNG